MIASRALLRNLVQLQLLRLVQMDMFAWMQLKTPNRIHLCPELFLQVVSTPLNK
jgi:hypothetical protein